MSKTPFSIKKKHFVTPEFVKAFERFKPANILEIDISNPIPSLQMFDEVKQKSYSRAQLLIKLAGKPLGIIEVALPLSNLDLTEIIWRYYSKLINDFMFAEGRGTVDKLDKKGLEYKRLELSQRAPLISVLIATRNKNEAIEPCIQSILNQSHSHFEIILVDNAPNSAALHDFIVRHYADESRLKYVREDEPGLAVAHNRGLLEAKGEFIAITDDDVEVDKHWLMTISEAFSLSPNIACVTGLILPSEIETPSQEWLEQYGGFNKGFNKRFYDLYENHPGDPLFPFTAGRFGSGANMSFRRENLIALGGFDAALGAGSKGIGGDDLAAFFDIISEGYTLVYEPSAIVYHQHRKDYEDLRKQVFNYGIGLTAYLTKTIIDQPSRLFFLGRKFFRGLYHIFDANSPKNQNKLANYPNELSRLELKGMFLGPLAYLQSRRSSKNLTLRNLKRLKTKRILVEDAS